MGAIQFTGGDSPQRTNLSYTSSGIKELREYNGVGTITNGAVTFNLTEDQTATGAAIFKTIYSIQPTAMLVTPGSTLSDVAKASPRSLSADRKQLVIQASRPGAAVTLLATSLLSADVWAPNGTLVYVTVKGE